MTCFALCLCAVNEPLVRGFGVFCVEGRVEGGEEGTFHQKAIPSPYNNFPGGKTKPSPKEKKKAHIKKAQSKRRTLYHNDLEDREEWPKCCSWEPRVTCRKKGQTQDPTNLANEHMVAPPASTHGARTNHEVDDHSFESELDIGIHQRLQLPMGVVTQTRQLRLTRSSGKLVFSRCGRWAAHRQWLTWAEIHGEHPKQIQDWMSAQ